MIEERSKGEVGDGGRDGEGEAGESWVEVDVEGNALETGWKGGEVGQVEEEERRVPLVCTVWSHLSALYISK